MAVQSKKEMYFSESLLQFVAPCVGCVYNLFENNLFLPSSFHSQNSQAKFRKYNRCNRQQTKSCGPNFFKLKSFIVKLVRIYSIFVYFSKAKFAKLFEYSVD
jgi:hypothetical protein